MSKVKNTPPDHNILPEQEPEIIEDDSECSDDENMLSDMEMDMGDGFDISSVLMTEDGDTICSAIVDASNGIEAVAKQLATQNKILIKLLAKLT